jgi:hypothetical protein
MAYITITNTDEGFMTLREGIAPSDMESEFFCAHLVERLRWAVEDAHVAPTPAPSQDDNSHRPTRQRVRAAGVTVQRLPPASAPERDVDQVLEVAHVH